MNFKFNAAPSNKVETGTYSSKEQLIANKFKEWLKVKEFDMTILNNEEAIKQALAKSHISLMGSTPENVILEFKKLGYISVAAPEKAAKKEIIIEKIETKHIELKGLTKVENEEIAAHLEDNKIFLEKDIFHDDKDLDYTLDNALTLGRENGEEAIVDTKAHCLAFAAAGLIKGGVAEVEKDLNELAISNSLIKKKQEEEQNSEVIQNLNRRKKVATIVESAISFCVTKLNWYGKKISIKKTSEFDDVKRGTDEIFEIKDQDDESYFMGLAIDVTYRGLLSGIFKNKFDKLLESISLKQKTKIKYFKNNDGKMMKEFAVPKIVLFFNVNDVRELVRLVKNKDDPKVLEEFKNSPQKIAVMNQLIIQCELLASFAEKHHNSIFSKYSEIVNSIKQLAWSDPEIKTILEARHEDEVSHHMKYLIKEFEEKEKQNKLSNSRR